MKKSLLLAVFLWVPTLYAQDITRVEYYLDADPGYGNAMSVPITPGPDLDLSFTAALSDLSDGFHVLYVRAQDDSGKWSLPLTRPFLKDAVTLDTPADLGRIEYYIDTDPGYGNATSFSVIPSSDLNINFVVDLAEVSDGFHILSVRARDATGKWSLLLTRPFLKAVIALDTPTDIVQVEYYTDTDPGYGNGISVSFTPGQDLTLDFIADLTDLSDGFHMLYVRALDSTGKWSAPLTRLFLKTAVALDPAQDITRVEYYLDADPGYGNATSVLITPGPDVTLSFTAALSDLSDGFHVLYVRARDATGKWSQIHTHPFLKEFVEQDIAADVVRVEYYFDADPGYGNGTPVVITPGANLGISFVADVSSLTDGTHILYVRALDVTGKWSQTFTRPFRKERVALDPAPAITRIEYIFKKAGTISDVRTFEGFDSGDDVTLDFSADVTGLEADSTWTVHVAAVDETGRRSLPVIHAFTVLGEAIARIAPGSIDFGQILLGRTVTKSLTIHGIGNIELSVTDIVASLVAISETAFTIAPGDSHIITITLTPAGAGAVTDTLVITSNDASMPSIRVPVSGIALRRGDLTRDGTIKIVDVIALVRMILNPALLPPSESFGFLMADVNDDGAVNILDIVRQVNIILGLQTKVAVTPSTPTIMSLGDIQSGDDRQLAIPVMISSDAAIAGIQMMFTFDPEALQVGIPRLAEQTDGMAIEGLVSEGVLRVVVYSTVGRSLAVGTEPLVVVPLIIPDESQEAPTFTLAEVMLSNPQALALPVMLGTTMVKVEALPTEFALKPNRPNPFNPTTRIAYDVPQQAHMTLVIYNVLGQQVVRLVDEMKAPGRYVVTWDGRNRRGAHVASGVYMYRLTSSTGFSQTKRMALVK